ncbi:MAG: MMPL family transporter [Vicinamibacteria bacterium]|nr:MMPL family transporter [Vicinamibacteria bacterium]
MKARLENFLFGHRRLVLVLFAVVTVLLGASASRLRVDAGFAKLLPLQHEYMRTYMQYRDEFGGANRVLIALKVREGDIFTPQFFATLKSVTDDVFFIPGVDRARVSSLFTPNVRFTEVVEDGISGGNVVPADFEPTAEGLAKVRRNVLKSGYVGRLVANDFTAALVSAELLEIDPRTGARLDYIHVADQLEAIRLKHSTNGVGVAFDYHILGFAKVIGDIASGARRVVLFFAIAFFVTAVFVFVYSQSIALTVIPLVSSVTAVVWTLGLLPLLGYGIDPMSILVPFLVFAVGVSHGVQMISVHRAEFWLGHTGEPAARAAFRKLLVPGSVALLTDCIGFVTILLIDIQMIREMAITASLGVAMILIINMLLVPLLLSWVHHDEIYLLQLKRRHAHVDPLWHALSRLTERRRALVVAGIALLLLAWGYPTSNKVQIGDLHAGVPELHADSRYNIDTDVVTRHFSIGVDLLTVITEVPAQACTDHAVMSVIDRFEWEMRNVPGVQSVVALPTVAKLLTAGWNEGSLEWRVLPRDTSLLAQAVTYVDTSTGLLNGECSVMPVLIFTTDHKAQTIDRIVAEVKAYQASHGNPDVKFRLATGNLGVMAATNEEVAAAQFPILGGVFAAVIALCLLSFRSWRIAVCIVLPLALVSLLAYALMAVLEIGLKVSTLPVAALGVGIGVDYGIYLFGRMAGLLEAGEPLKQAYHDALTTTGNGVIFTGLTLAMGVATWIFSPLKFQADMGILLTFLFLFNMLGAILLLPALAHFLWRGATASGKEARPTA